MRSMLGQSQHFTRVLQVRRPCVARIVPIKIIYSLTYLQTPVPLTAADIHSFISCVDVLRVVVFER